MPDGGKLQRWWDRQSPFAAGLVGRNPGLFCALLLLIINVAIVWPLFCLEYSAYTESIEGTFIAIPRIMAKYPGQWSWFPYWNGGMPFETSYLPFSHWIVAGFTLLSGFSAARSFHIVTAAIYSLGAVSAFCMAYEFSRKLAASFVASLAYSCVSMTTLLIPKIRADAGGALNLRRLQDLVYYGESPHTVALVLLPIAMVCFSRALKTDAGSLTDHTKRWSVPQAHWKIAAGVLAAFVVLSNAFGIVMLAAALLCWLLAFSCRPWWKPVATVAAIGILSYCWISPWLSPSMIRAIRANSLTTGGDYRYTAANWMALAMTAAGMIMLWLVMRRTRSPEYLRFFVFLAYVPTAFVATWYTAQIPLIPQPSRYELELDLLLILALVFAASAVLERLPKPARIAVAAVFLVFLGFQAIHSMGYARRIVRPAELSRMDEYKVSKWLDQNRPGEQSFISGAATFLYNVFTDNPQLRGGHDQHTVNTFLPIVGFTVYSGMNAGDRDAEFSIFWLKAYGVHTITVPGHNDPFHPFAHPHKFEGLLPLLWREGDVSIYEVQKRTQSLAHVIPSSAVVARRPIHGLDIAPVEAYVAALDDPQYPPAPFRWKGMSEAEIHATVDRGQAISVQVTYGRGWEAWAGGTRLPVRGDAIGQVVIEPGRAGKYDISLRYTGGMERTATRGMSLLAVLVALGYGWRGRRNHALTSPASRGRSSP